jgi:hypothetical protein
MVRVAKPGGMLGIFDGDYASLTFGSDDPAQGKVDDQAIIKALVTNPRVMRQMPQLLRETGLDLIASFGNVVADVGKADFICKRKGSGLVSCVTEVKRSVAV